MKRENLVIKLAKAKMKEVYINLLNKDKLQFFIELLSDKLKHTEFALAYREGRIKLRLFGEREEVARAVQIAKELGKMFIQSTNPDAEGYYIHSLEIMQQASQKIISLDSISSVLNHIGFPSEVSERGLVTKAPLDKVKEIVDTLHSIVMELPSEIKSQAMKKILLTVSYCTNISTDFIVEKGLKEGYFKENNERYIVIAKTPEQCIEGLIKELNKEENKKEYEEEIKRKNKLTRIIFDEKF